MTQAAPRPPLAIGLYLAAVQFAFVLGWVVYASYLPRLAAQAGLPPQAVPWLLMADQLVFVVTDLAVGLASDRAASLMGRLGRWMLGVSLLSAAAFVLLPWLAPLGSPWVFAGVALLWAVTTSALRAPPLTLLGRYVSKPAQPTLVALNSLGLGLASALAPYLGLQFAQADPRLPFVLSAAVLAALTLGMVAAERALARQAAAASAATAPSPAAPEASAPSTAARLGFLLACVLGAAAFQWHHAVSSAPLWLRQVGAEQLPVVLPLFWVGFNLCLALAPWLVRRLGPGGSIAVGAELAMVAVAGAAFAPSPAWLGGAQVAAGAGWAVLLCAAFSGALALGATGREGLMSGALSSTLALAALGRIGWVATATPTPAHAAALALWPAAGFAACAVLLVALALRR